MTENELMKAAASRLFNQTDVDGSGTISRAEYEAVLGFEKLNTNSDSVLSKSEFMGLYSRGRRGAGTRSLEQQAAVLGVNDVEGTLTLAVGAAASASAAGITKRQYALLAFKTSLPFVAFGFVDNFIMILAGDQIEASIGVVLSLSTMAAAGLGNTFSDVVGIISSERIEVLVERLGLPVAGLTSAQLLSTGARRAHLLAQIAGIVLGCLLGLCPLLFIDQEGKALKAAFEDADTNKNGALDIREIERALHRYGLMMDNDEVRWLMQRCDKDHSGAMELPEFIELVKHWEAYNNEYHEARKGGRTPTIAPLVQVK